MGHTELAPGLTGKVETTVTQADLALTLGSGDVTVLGTPRMIALAEAATVDAIAAALEEGKTSVGTRVDVRHLAATPEGREVRAEAELVSADGNALTFAVTVHDAKGKVAEGTVERFIVDRAKFIARAYDEA